MVKRKLRDIVAIVAFLYFDLIALGVGFIFLLLAKKAFVEGFIEKEISYCVRCDINPAQTYYGYGAMYIGTLIIVLTLAIAAVCIFFAVYTGTGAIRAILKRKKA